MLFHSSQIFHYAVNFIWGDRMGNFHARFWGEKALESKFLSEYFLCCREIPKPQNPVDHVNTLNEKPSANPALPTESTVNQSKFELDDPRC